MTPEEQSRGTVQVQVSEVPQQEPRVVWVQVKDVPQQEPRVVWVQVKDVPQQEPRVVWVQVKDVPQQEPQMVPVVRIANPEPKEPQMVPVVRIANPEPEPPPAVVPPIVNLESSEQSADEQDQGQEKKMKDSFEIKPEELPFCPHCEGLRMVEYTLKIGLVDLNKRENASLEVYRTAERMREEIEIEERVFGSDWGKDYEMRWKCECHDEAIDPGDHPEGQLVDNDLKEKIIKRFLGMTS